MSTNPYLFEVRQTLPRLLALFDVDRTSWSYGLGDRYFWAWGLIDFANGTFQGAAHGMARLWRHGLWPYQTSAEQFLCRVDSLFRGAGALVRKNGSLEEAFPNEGSYCVTALVAFDLLCALELLGQELDATTYDRWRDTVRPMIEYLLEADETHAIISNHLATAVAALTRWHALTGDVAAERRAIELLDRILAHQSTEGWFCEYEGADPGYQSLCTYYLADVERARPDWNLIEPLRNSIAFLWHFAHPDGSFGGVYGSRCTRFYYPAGVLALSDRIPEAAALADFMAGSIGGQRVVTLLAMDEPNLVPMFNAYCWAAAMASDGAARPVQPMMLPCLDSAPLRRRYPVAGLIIDRGAGHYTVVSTHKGGVIAHFSADKPARHDHGIVVRHASGALGSSQSYVSSNKVEWQGRDIVAIESTVAAMPKQLPSPLGFLLLRVLCMSMFRVSYLREWVKRQLVRLLITRPNRWPVRNRRTISFGQNLMVTDATDLPERYRRDEVLRQFVPIHMASQGYWQRQDDEPQL